MAIGNLIGAGADDLDGEGGEGGGSEEARTQLTRKPKTAQSDLARSTNFM